ncbi:hypothetical protein ACF1AE_02465 [Streptomyces sp. NPDC014986]|uniref:hypothetical protein n=1 Tax=Streptomyces sp. NPDC014986 TaxID=3364934 RepID=UPI0036F53A5B
MRALSARRIAIGALCAAVVAGITGPAAVAAETAAGHDRATSSAALLARAGNAHAHASELGPVLGLLKAVLETRDGRLTPERARTLGGAAKAALVRAAADDDPTIMIAIADTTAPLTTAPAAPAPTAAASALTAPVASTTVTGVLPPAAAELLNDLPGAVREALDDLLDVLLPEAGTGAAPVLPSAGDLLTRVDNLVAALLGGEPQVSTLPAPAEAAAPAPAALPALTPLTPVLPPSS